LFLDRLAMMVESNASGTRAKRYNVRGRGLLRL
jgi:hypothetical protein